MRAIVQDVYGPVDVLRLAEIETPVVAANELLIQVHAAGVDPSVWHLMTGLPYLVRPAFGLRTPKLPIRGRDLAGRVVAVGKDVAGFEPGDEVFGTNPNGSYAEYVCVDAKRLAHKPARLSFAQAAAIPTSACAALGALRDQGRVQSGQRVLIVGAGGGIGTFAVQLAKHFGATVTGVCSTSKVELVRGLGADEVVDYTARDFPDLPQRYDLIVDTAGNRPLSRQRRALTRRGTLVLVGGEGGGRFLGGTDRLLRAPLLSLFLRQSLRVLMSGERADDLRLLAELAEAGALTPVVDRVYPLAAAPAAIEDMMRGRARGKLVIGLTPEGGLDPASPNS